MHELQQPIDMSFRQTQTAVRAFDSSTQPDLQIDVL
jgi:hypothetical protein